MRIAIVDDHPPTRQLLGRVLREDGHEIKPLASCAGIESLLAAGSSFDAIVLDVMLPDGSGIELCARLRAAKHAVPILLLTARGEVRDRVRGLEAGADDYLPKPFAVAELRARLRALMRRGPVLRDRAIRLGAVLVDLEARRVLLDGSPVPLTARELSIVELLASRRGRVVSRDHVIEAIWGDASERAGASLDVLIARIRRKLGAHAHLLQTLRGVGYVFGEPP